VRRIWHNIALESRSTRMISTRHVARLGKLVSSPLPRFPSCFLGRDSCSIQAMMGECTLTAFSTGSKRPSRMFLSLLSLLQHRHLKELERLLTVAYSCCQQLSRSRTMATVIDDPLSKKVEMTNWEKVWLQHYFQLALFSALWPQNKTLIQVYRATTSTTSMWTGVDAI